MILIQTLVSFKAQKQGFVINRKKTNNVIHPKSVDTQRKKEVVFAHMADRAQGD